MKTIVFKPGGRKTRIIVGSSCIDESLYKLTNIFPFLRENIRVAVISQRHILQCHYKSLRKSLNKLPWAIESLEFRDGEDEKSIDNYENLMTKLLENPPGFNLVIAFGGGVVGDISGFIASTYRRGIPIIQIPTTVVAMSDAAIGGKTAINFRHLKNMVGTFHHPIAIISDVQFLRTLPEREYLSGLAEIIKYGIVLDKIHFSYMQKNIKKILKRENKSIQKIIETSSRIKASIVEKDEFDTLGIRNSLNYGHTVGHAIETGTNLSLFTHGEVVAIGMCAATFIAYNLNLISQNYFDEIIKLIKDYNLPTNIGSGIEPERIHHYMLYDKKNRFGKIRMVLPYRRGSFRVVDNIPKNLLLESIEFVKK